MEISASQQQQQQVPLTTATTTATTTKAKKKNTASDDITADIIAAAGVTQCRLIQRELLRMMVQPHEGDEKAYNTLQAQFMECLQDYAMRYAPSFSTARTPDNLVYYIDHASGKTSWERPPAVDAHLRMGVEKGEYDEPYSRCEYKHINLLQCSYTERAKKNQCQQEQFKLSACVRKMMQADDEDEEDEKLD